MVVTGPGQKSLLETLEQKFSKYFQWFRNSFDVKYGKPNPEPHLMGLQKAGVKANEAIVVENAPLGVRAGVAAGIFTGAVNTKPRLIKSYWTKELIIFFHSASDFSKTAERFLSQSNKIVYLQLSIYKCLY